MLRIETEVDTFTTVPIAFLVTHGEKQAKSEMMEFNDIRMKLPCLLLFILISTSAFGQRAGVVIRGSVTYTSSQNVYVAFENTKGIQPGDTLYSEQNGVENAVLLVKELSQSSCMCVPVGAEKLGVTAVVLARVPAGPNSAEPSKAAKELEVSKPVTQDAINALTRPKKEVNPNPLFNGRVSVTSYSNSSGSTSSQRFRYKLMLNAENIDRSNVSFESYLTFTHKLNDWQGLSNALKIYSLAVNYRAGKNKASSFTLGRKINVNMANVGAVDGLQYEYTHKTMKYGLLAGSRPDYFDYSFNADLLQFGAFISHEYQNEKGSIQTSLAVFQQMNQFKTDRRFAYLQHTNTLLRNLSLFCSVELDFYSLQHLKPKTGIDLTSTYISLRFKPVQDLSLSLSYDARKNIYYYETFKNQVDSLLDKETRQGYRFHFNANLSKNLSWGGSAGYRYKKSDIQPSLNANSYLTYSELPFLNASGTLDATYLKTNYLNGLVYGVSLARELFSDKLFAELKYRHVTYDYADLNVRLAQNIFQFGLSWRMAQKLMLSGDLESTQEPTDHYLRVYINLTQRF